MNQIRNISIVTNDLVALRAQAAPAAGTIAFCQTSPNIWQGFLYSTTSSESDDGNSVIKPDSISSANPGRWLLKATVTQEGNRAAYLIDKLAWGGNRAALMLEDGWSIIGIDATNVYIAKQVTLETP